MASLYNTNKYVPIFTQLTLHINIKSFVWELFITLEGNKHCVITKQVSQFPNLQWEETEYHLIFFFSFKIGGPCYSSYFQKASPFLFGRKTEFCYPAQTNNQLKHICICDIDAQMFVITLRKYHWVDGCSWHIKKLNFKFIFLFFWQPTPFQ